MAPILSTGLLHVYLVGCATRKRCLSSSCVAQLRIHVYVYLFRSSCSRHRTTKASPSGGGLTWIGRRPPIFSSLGLTRDCSPTSTATAKREYGEGDLPLVCCFEDGRLHAKRWISDELFHHNISERNLHVVVIVVAGHKDRVDGVKSLWPQCAVRQRRTCARAPCFHP